VKILDAQAGCEAPVYHSEARGPVAFTQDGNLLVSTPKQSQCEVLDIETGRELIRRGLGGQLEGLAVSLDGKRFACVVYFHPSSRPGYRDMQVWDIETGRRLTTLSKPDVRQLATPRSWVGVSLWCGSLFPGSVKLVSKGSPADMAGLKGGDRIISINDQQVSSSHELQRLMASQGVGSTIRLAVERDKSRVQLNVIPAEFPKDKDHLYYRPCLSFTRDGKQIVSGIGVSEDEAEAVVAQIWDAETGHPVRTLKPNPATSECIPFDFRANGGRFAFRTVGERTLNVVDAQTWRQLLAIATDPDSRFELSQDGKYIAFWQAGNAITLLDIETGREGVSLNGHTDQVTFIAFSRDGKRIFTTERGSILRVWDAQSGRELITEELHMEELDSAALSPDGRFLAVTGGNDGVVILKAADWRTPERQ
jgi:WD40 repeat protein